MVSAEVKIMALITGACTPPNKPQYKYFHVKTVFEIIFHNTYCMMSQVYVATQ